MIFIMLVHAAIGIVFGVFGGGPEPGTTEMSGPGFFQQLLTAIVTTPLGVGLIFIGAAVASGRTPRPASV